MKKPDFLIIGAMKCATSSLHEQLALQSGIFMSEPKELYFFSDDEVYTKGLDWYLSFFEQANPTDICGESTTHYTKLPTYPHTIERIKKHLPKAKFIYIMRHPIDRLISHYIHEWSLNNILIDINEAVDQYPELIEYSYYSKQLKPYFKAFGKENVLPIFFEHLLSHPQAELERACEFIGYQNVPQWQEELSRQNVSHERWRKTPFREFIVNNPILEKARQLLIPKAIREQVRKSWTMQKRPTLHSELYGELETQFNQDLGILGNWLGVELSCQNFKTVVTEKSFFWV